jgi:hypothetical protein
VWVVKAVGSHGPGPAPRHEKGAGLCIGSSGQGPGPLDMLLECIQNVILESVRVKSSDCTD